MTFDRASCAPAVCKYGGSSLATPERVGHVAAALAARHRAGEALVVVCSAMGATTDELLHKARALSHAPPARELDMLVTCGERAAVALLAIALDALGVPVLSLTGSQAGIVTDEAHQGARIVAVRPHRVAAGLARGQVVVVAGYQGVSRTQEVTTLGRGGSDATAVVLGAALGAREVALYSDVDGVYAADPRRVPGARHLPAIDYASLHALALGGARVVCAEAVRLAEVLGVELWARASRPAQDGGRQTRLGPHGARPSASAREVVPPAAPHGVALLPHVALLVGATAAQLRGACAVAAPEAEVRAAAQRRAVLVARATDAAPGLCRRLRRLVGPEVRLRPAALVTAVGPHAGELTLGPLWDRLRREGAAPWFWQCGPRLLQLAVPTRAAGAALDAVHRSVHGEG